ncbi:MAG: hypothetical protein WDW38_000868 [Sanguina aurantia]
MLFSASGASPESVTKNLVQGGCDASKLGFTCTCAGVAVAVATPPLSDRFSSSQPSPNPCHPARHQPTSAAFTATAIPHPCHGTASLLPCRPLPMSVGAQTAGYGLQTSVLHQPKDYSVRFKTSRLASAAAVTTYINSVHGARTFTLPSNSHPVGTKTGIAYSGVAAACSAASSAISPINKLPSTVGPVVGAAALIITVVFFFM